MYILLHCILLLVWFLEWKSCRSPRTGCRLGWQVQIKMPCVFLHKLSLAFAVDLLKNMPYNLCMQSCKQTFKVQKEAFSDWDTVQLLHIKKPSQHNCLAKRSSENRCSSRWSEGLSIALVTSSSWGTVLLLILEILGQACSRVTLQARDRNCIAYEHLFPYLLVVM